MDGFTKSYQQLAEMVRAMTPGSRVAAALLLGVVIVSIAYLAGGQVGTGDTFLLAGETFSTSQLREIQAALGKAGLEAEFDGARIKVPRGQEAKYMAALAEAGALPEDFGGHLRKAVSGGSFAMFGPQQEARMKVAIQSELQSVIAQMKGIERAFVHIEEDRKRGFREQTIVTASVAVQPRANHTLEEGTVAAIRSLVASARPPLRPDAVTVVDLSHPGQFVAAATNSGRTAPAGAYADAKKRLEQDWEEKIGRLLARIVPGAYVTASVELAPSRVETPVAEASPQAPAGSAEVVGAGPIMRNVTVTVAVPSTHFESVWRQRTGRRDALAGRPDPSELAGIEAGERKKIEDAVRPLLGGSSSRQDLASQIAIITYPVAPMEQPVEAPWNELALAWCIEHGSTLGLSALVLVGLIVLRSLARSTPATAAPVADRATDADVALMLSSPDEPPHQPAGPHLRARSGTSPLSDELAEVVRQDPQAALSVLRSWIGNQG